MRCYVASNPGVFRSSLTAHYHGVLHQSEFAPADVSALSFAPGATAAHTPTTPGLGASVPRFSSRALECVSTRASELS